jgi:hypothetical protein
MRVEPQGAKQMAAPAEPRTPNLHRANNSLLESANGSMATVAPRQENNDVSQTKNKIALTPTGLLMEGDCAHSLGGNSAGQVLFEAFAVNS